MKEIQEMIEKNEKIKEYLNYPIEELRLMRMYIILGLISVDRESEKQSKVTMLRSCKVQTNNNNFLTNILDCKYNLEAKHITDEFMFKAGKLFIVCNDCNLKKCFKQTLPQFIDAIDEYNETNQKQLRYIDVLDFILKRNVPQFKSTPSKEFFDEINIIDLLYVHVILELDLINIKKYDNKTGNAQFQYLDLSNLSSGNNFNYFLNYYKDGTGQKNITINVKEKDFYDEQNYYLSLYKIAAYYKYLIEIEKIDIIKALRNMLIYKNANDTVSIRDYYVIYKYNKEINELPFSNKAKQKIKEIFNYVLNYRYRKNIPFVPLNFIIYSEDKEIVEYIVELMSEFMSFFEYLPKDSYYYKEHIDNIILDKYSIRNIFYEENQPRNGVILLHNFTNLLYIDSKERTLLLNILANDIERNSDKICTFINGNRQEIDQVLDQHYKFKEKLFNVEIDVEDLNEEKIYNLIIEKLSKDNEITENVKEKLKHYIDSTYKQDNTKNIDYADKLYNEIILQKTKEFNLKEKNILTLENIPECFNDRDLPTILKELNSLTGLSNIKMQIKDLLSLLKFNKKAQLDINNLNLHMVFTGNSGTGKTTVARLITDILYNLRYINQNRLVEVTAKDLIAEYVGQTAGKTYNVIKSALGGVLFIDEAYSITMENIGEGASFGSECIAMLLKLMEDYKKEIVIIFAGYKNEMEKFEKSNPGLSSRIGYKIDFPDYTIEELTTIFLQLLKKNSLDISKKALEDVKNIIRDSTKIENFGNARYINNLFQKILVEHAKNEEKHNYSKNIYMIKKEDIQYDKLIANNLERKIGF